MNGQTKVALTAACRNEETTGGSVKRSRTPVGVGSTIMTIKVTLSFGSAVTRMAGECAVSQHEFQGVVGSRHYVHRQDFADLRGCRCSGL